MTAGLPGEVTVPIIAWCATLRATWAVNADTVQKLDRDHAALRVRMLIAERIYIGVRCTDRRRFNDVPGVTQFSPCSGRRCPAAEEVCSGT